MFAANTTVQYVNMLAVQPHSQSINMLSWYSFLMNTICGLFIYLFAYLFI